MVLKAHHLRPAPGAKKAKTRKGRGEGSKGKTAGRGGKGEVSIDDLYKLGAARKGRPVKVLGNGDISVKVNVTVHSFSSSASEKISAAGGSIKTL